MISVIIPVYNGEGTLSGCIESVLSQSYTDWELIIVNDGSTDNTADVCKKYSSDHTNIRIFEQENIGVSAARNLGLSKAFGDYITFLDADDIIPPHYLKVLFDHCKHSDISVCDVVSIENGAEKVRFTMQDCEICQTEALNCLLTRKYINSGPYAKLFRAEIVKEMRFPSLKAYEDILFVCDAFAKSEKVSVTNKTEYVYFQNPSGAMSSFKKIPSVDIVNATDKLLLFIEGRSDLCPDTLYITASHLMQYVIPLSEEDPTEKRDDFIKCSISLYRRHIFKILRCKAFPWKEKLLYFAFCAGIVYTNKKIKRIKL